MKKLLSLITLIGLAMAASAQQYAPTTLYSRVNFSTYHLGPGAATNFATAYTIGCSDYGDLAVFITANGSNHSSAVWQSYEETNALVAVLAPSVDGTYFDTNILNLVHVYGYASTNIGAPFVTGSKTWDTGAYGYYKLIYVTNAMSEMVATNITVKYTFKPRQRDYR